MQIRRTPDDAKFILENLYLGEKVDPSEIQPTVQKPVDLVDKIPEGSKNTTNNDKFTTGTNKKESVMVQYTWSNFFLQSLAFSKSLVAN